MFKSKIIVKMLSLTGIIAVFFATTSASFASGWLSGYEPELPESLR